MTRFTIRNRWTNAVIYEGYFETMRDCVVAAVKARADLAGADLASANLASAYLARANLTGANLTGANLTGANLTGANLAGAYLADANLTGANLAGANLTGANLASAYLGGASLARADLTGANLASAKWRDGFTLNRSPVRIAHRGDGYTFYLLDTSQGWRISAGCRFFTPDEAWKHWERTRPDDTPGSLGAETRDILTFFELAIERETKA
jgi:hypothetical protein